MRDHCKNIAVTLVACLAGAAGAWAHAFLEHTDPAVGSSVKAAPGEVSLTFTAPLELGGCSVQVFDAAGKQVDQKNLRADPKEARRLLVSLSAGLASGTYKVVWRAESKDTHVTNGDFMFRVEP